MITIDYALRIYTDMLNAGDKIDIGYFNENLSVKDFEEFQELTPFINLLKSSNVTQKFQTVFSRVDAHKESIYELQSAANFRSQRNSNSEEATKKLNQIFDEEFGDE
ncbi:MAG: hypothetical protein P4L59_10115 [Desulfosporosinus sp.]|nr:hypothetical protein [Desulfosporosinus sp.]